MRFLKKIAQKCSPTHFLSKLITFFRGKKVAKNFGQHISAFVNKLPKVNNRPIG
jgi:hypothetical protein